ncbi:hypothetical protein KEM56_007521 [Ascosphaera pollenicola]|nr:hypothetical protein KEM56_007521 [Ascosphaera pollenicola]
MQSPIVKAPVKPSSVQGSPCCPSWPSASNIDLFVRNLYLLDLHKLPGWPGISARLLSPSQQNLRPRIKAVEWALYHLFSIWDPQETAAKLNPFSLPIDQLQSSNLRTALFRVLSDLRKTGVLGRDVTMRKSMFDDCKGEKFEELLAVFSTTVLRLQLEKAKGKADTVPPHIMAVSEEYTLPMLIALRASLQAHAKDGSHLHEISTRAAKLLGDQEEEFDARLNHSTGRTLKEDDTVFQETYDKVIQSWRCDQSWADVILKGGSAKSRDDRLWKKGFPELWRLLKQDTSTESLPESDSCSSSDPLSLLESRVAEQRSRLQMWKDFRNSLSKEKSRSQRLRSRDHSSHHVFQRHQDLIVTAVSRNSESASAIACEPAQMPEHASLIEAMNVALLESNSKNRKRDQYYGRTRGRRDSRQISRPAYNEGSSTQSLQSQSHHLSDDPFLRKDPETELSPAHEVIDSKDNSSLILEQQMEFIHPPPPQSDPEPPLAPTQDQKPPVEAPGDTPSTDDVLSEQPSISPEPAADTKHLTLTERTKKSMSFFTEGTDSLDDHASRTTDNFLSPDPFKSPVRSVTSGPQTPRHMNEDRFISGSSTPREELFNQEADYASVFKSRPKIALSPVRPPLPRFNDSHIEDVLDDEGNEGPSMIDDTMMISSPLSRKFK